MDASKVVIIGAGPYGLSIAAHFRARGIEFRIFGKPMDSWRRCMPAGMFLKSEGSASNLHDPGRHCTLERFCAEQGLPYKAVNLPVPLDTFTTYGLAFQQQLVPNLEERDVVALDRANQGFLLRLDNGETVIAERAVVAVGIRYFPHISAGLAHLPPGVVSHSSDHHNVSGFRGRQVSVIGGGASALDLSVALHEAGAEIHLIARRSRLKFNIPAEPSLWTKWRPRSRLGGGWRSHFYEHAPMVFRHLPLEARSW
ncbi:MAG: NAD(P)/FAD-dependent oxidoreductase, partial [Acetobacteraceae bacterium]|nr:NAD(P)/FAD-dependent oxidoreductase [Acetobacteraceae bacterium]